MYQAEQLLQSLLQTLFLSIIRILQNLKGCVCNLNVEDCVLYILHLITPCFLFCFILLHIALFPNLLVFRFLQVYKKCLGFIQL